MLKYFIQNAVKWGIGLQAAVVFLNGLFIFGYRSQYEPGVDWVFFMVSAISSSWLNWLIIFAFWKRRCMALGFLLTATAFFYFPDFSYLIWRIDYVVLWKVIFFVLSVAAFIAFICQSDDPAAGRPQTRHKKIKDAFKGIAVGIICIVTVFGLLMFELRRETGRQGGEAPHKSFEERKEWGRHLPGYRESFKHIEEWVGASELIASDVGEIIDIAPAVGGPNYYQGCFTDGCHTAMYLEVEGQRGTGFLYLPGVNYGSYQYNEKPKLYVSPEFWIFKARTQAIDAQGRSCLKANGLEEEYLRWMSLDVMKDREELIKGYKIFNEAIKSKHVDWPRYHYLMLLNKFAQAFENQGEDEQAVDLYMRIYEARILLDPEFTLPYRALNFDDIQRRLDNLNKPKNVFYPSGKLRLHYHYSHGKKDGISKEYFEDGKLKREWLYKEGELDGVSKEYYATGELRYEYNYLDGKAEGPSKEYFKDGRIKGERLYHNGFCTGIAQGLYEYSP